MNRMPNAASRSSGFTLMELMVVVAIVAIVAAAVVPSFSRTLQKNRQRDAAMLIVEAVFAARSRATRTGRCHRVRVYMDASSMQSGTGGAVALDASQATNCNAATQAGATWTRLSYKSVSQSVEQAQDIQAAAQGTTHPGIVGEDIAILRVLDANGQPVAGNPDEMLFTPSGWLFNSMGARYYEIVIDTGSGALGVRRHVRVSPGGSVRYTIYEPP